MSMSATASNAVGDPWSQQLGLPVAPSRGPLRPVPIQHVVLQDGFWHDRQEVNKSQLLPHSREWMERLGWIDAFRRAGRGEDGRPRQGKLFTDSDVYKLLEAVAWENAREKDEVLESWLRDIGGAIRTAQDEDGYLNTWFGNRGSEERYKDLAHGHELYCYGHLLQAAVARLRDGAQDDITEAARRVADHMVDVFGSEDSASLDGHPEVEVALVEYARATGQEKYLDLAGAFLDRRGHRTLPQHEIGPEYYLDDIPIREATIMRGHAIRALYLHMAAVDYAVERQDSDLLDRLIAQWDATIAKRTYIHGGMGAHHLGESFGGDYELPPDRAYAETCSGVAGVMLAWRLTLATGESRFADFAERALYNMVATALHPNGRRYLYVNPLQVRYPQAPVADDEVPFRKDTLRAPWFWVSCCPTNIARLLGSLTGYVATTSDGGLQIHQLLAARITTDVLGEPVELQVRTDYPWDGEIVIEVISASGRPWELSVRVPAWAHNATLTVDGRSIDAQPGMVAVQRAWQAGDVVRLNLGMEPRLTYPDPRVEAVRGCVAVERGPLVYCAEFPAEDAEATFSVDPANAPMAERRSVGEGLDPEARTISLPVRRSDSPGEVAWPFDTEPTPQVATTETDMDLIPLHLWGLRGPSVMRVFHPTTASGEALT